jgi:hypothetical protein
MTDARFEYDSYGESLGHTGTSDTPLQYNGRFGVQTDNKRVFAGNPSVLRTTCHRAPTCFQRNYRRLFDDPELALVQRQCLALDGADKKPLGVWQLFRQHPFAVSQRMLDEQLDRLGNELLPPGWRWLRR